MYSPIITTLYELVPFLFCFGLVCRNNQGVQDILYFDALLCIVVFFDSEYDGDATENRPNNSL